MLKRPRHASIDTPTSPDPSSPLTKRARFRSSPIRPSTSLSTPSTHLILRTPLTVPQDSPNNPFGLKRSLIALELPPVTSFSQHRTLRFQLVDKERKVGRDTRGGVFRIVQVPLSYTFRHLHKLILFLFATDLEVNQVHSIKKAMKSKAGTSVKRRRASSAASSHRGKGKGKARGESEQPSWGGHWFEIMKNVVMERAATKAGAISDESNTWIKASSIRDRRLFKDVFDPHDVSGDNSPNPLDEDEPEDGTWKWEAEDDLTLGTVWSDVPDLDKGIIYVCSSLTLNIFARLTTPPQHHSPTVSVHITINTTPVESRRGRSNTPHVFTTKGSSAGLIRVTHTTLDEHGHEGTSNVDDTSDTTGTPDPDTQLKRWNEEGAFASFLEAEADRERALRRRHSPSPDFSSPSCDIPSLLYDDRSSSTTPDVFPSSDDPVLVPSEFESELEVEADLTRYSDSVLFPFANSAITPYPANPFRQRRVKCAERRLSRLTARGMRAVMSDDEEDARKRARKREKRKERAKEKAEKEKLQKKVAAHDEEHEDEDEQEVEQKQGEEGEEEEEEEEEERSEQEGVQEEEEDEEEQEDEEQQQPKTRSRAALAKARTRAHTKQKEDAQRIQRMLKAGATAAAKRPGAKSKAPRIWREWENEEVELDEEGNVRDLLGIYEAEV
ncbi:hypothetical protein EIP86_008858 [Pleurotus ostreatoroseus]|nr:hypothetical protein EIP86_008858 [Pleurotus ostreatoroseus]